MAFRILLLLVAVWAVIGAPALCSVGAVAHACACEEEPACDHECDCDADPCSELVFRKDESDSPVPAFEGAPDMVLFVLEVPRAQGPAVSAVDQRGTGPPPASRHAQVFPLLN